MTEKLINFYLCILTTLLINAGISFAYVNRCADWSQCNGDDEPVCALDAQNVCFQVFPSLCHLLYVACITQKDYDVFHNAYCSTLNGFLCDKGAINTSELALDEQLLSQNFI